MKPTPEEEMQEQKIEMLVKYVKEGTIILDKQLDGNWKGWTQKNGKLIEVRQIDPGTVLGLLLTHE